MYDEKTEIFKKRIIEIYGEEAFDFSLTRYPQNNHCKIKMICKRCGKTFEKRVDLLLRGSGCDCQRNDISKGEVETAKWLDTNNIRYITQKRFSDCKDKQPLPFDFYLPDYNVCIEYQGQQHFRINTLMSKNLENAKKNLELVQKHDQIKRDYCKAKGIYEIEIVYDEDINHVLNIEYFKFKDRFSPKTDLVIEPTVRKFGNNLNRCSAETTHTRICKVCGKEFEPEFLTKCNVYSEVETCSDECAKKLREQKSLEKWGYDDPSRSPEVREKLRKTCLKKYGVINAGGTKESLEKAKQTNLERYGVENGA